VRVWSEIAYIDGLRLLGSLHIINAEEVNARLAMLQNLEPRQLLNRTELDNLLAGYEKKASAVINKKQALLEDYKASRSKELAEYKKIDESLRIKPTDPWNVVVGKAISLRGLGRTSEASAEFEQYAAMFSSKDPGAKQYARTAQGFTLQHKQLGVSGGVYIYALNSGGGMKGGLMVGDIVTLYNNRLITNMIDFDKVIHESPTVAGTTISFLRLISDGTFVHGHVTLPEPSLEASMMPI
jgi:hypothetical protein